MLLVRNRGHFHSPASYNEVIHDVSPVPVLCCIQFPLRDLLKSHHKTDNDVRSRLPIQNKLTSLRNNKRLSQKYELGASLGPRLGLGLELGSV